MKTFINRFALLAAGALVLGTTTAWGQTLKAQIPFAFQTSHKVLAAGEYTVTENRNMSGSNVATLRSVANGKTVFALAMAVENHATGAPAVTFYCGKDGCRLGSIRTPQGTVSYSAAPARTASRNEEVAVVELSLRAVNGD